MDQFTKDTLFTVLIGIAGLVAGVAIVLGVCWLILRVSKAFYDWLNPPDVIAAAYRTRILTPDWEAFERHLQRRPPEALQKLYADHALLLADDLEYNETHSIRFCAIDEKARFEKPTWLPPDVIPLANSNDDVIYLQPGPRATDSVMITYHDGGETEILAPTVAIFLERLRRTTNA